MRVSRRTLVKLGLIAGAGGLAGLGSYTAIRSLLSEVGPQERRLESFIYPNVAAVPEIGGTGPWWVEEGLVGAEARLSDFRPGTAANVVWQAIANAGGEANPSAGLPALLVRVEEGEDLTLPAGYDPSEFIIRGLYALFNLCPHAGCRPAWKLHPVTRLKDPSGPKEPICCACHYAQFHPWEFTEYRHPEPPESTGTAYPGVRLLGGPANRGMPLIPLKLDGDRLIGVLRYPEWYSYLDFREWDLWSV